ncbi:MAG TPA: hypothetical protein VJ818_01835 [Actinomycetota bacterium]|nr:hypothetical protein [Actinomycetota bacterium]
MRRPWLGIVALAISGVIVGLLAYNAGYSHGLAHSGTAVTVVRDTGFFPLGFFAIFFLGMFALRLFFWSSRRRRWPRDRFDRWHEKQHEIEHKR